MEKILEGTPIAVNEEGYLTNFAQWTPQIAQAIAAEYELALTVEHWKVLTFLQDQFKEEIPLSIRKIGKSGVVTIKDFYRLFPKGPLKKASKIAGIPKPASCI